MRRAYTQAHTAAWVLMLLLVGRCSGDQERLVVGTQVSIFPPLDQVPQAVLEPEQPNIDGRVYMRDIKINPLNGSSS